MYADPGTGGPRPWLRDGRERLAHAVARGQMVADAARAAGVTEATARSQLKSIHAEPCMFPSAELAGLLNRFAR